MLTRLIASVGSMIPAEEDPFKSKCDLNKIVLNILGEPIGQAKGTIGIIAYVIVFGALGFALVKSKESTHWLRKALVAALIAMGFPLILPLLNLFGLKIVC